jgi:demethylmenaquinone methyltransferase/2-methoxy-6-polyprenyl-1,4-benzoquinol methylase
LNLNAHLTPICSGFVKEAYLDKNVRVGKKADLNKDPKEVAAMFDGVAKRYDFLNDLLSLNRTKAWRRVATSIIAPKKGMRILDIAAGTGSSSRPLADAGAEVVALDFSQGMLDAGRKRNPDLTFIQGDALKLPFGDNEFDVATISFGLRNTNNAQDALVEAHRVVKPGGRMVVVEFSHPTNKIFRTIYMKYLMRALPVIARKTSSNPDAYIYLAESIQAWPNQKGLAKVMEAAGWQRVGWQDLTFGIVAIHIGHKPAFTA